MDTFTQKRLIRFVEKFRLETGQLPVLNDFAKEGFDKACVQKAESLQLIEQFYITLTDGSIRKGYKIKQN
jgi:hypothetical protein